MTQNKTTPEYRIARARSMLIVKIPFFAALLMTMDSVEDASKGPTMGTDGNAIYYNPSYIDTLSDGELMYVLVHETMHAALGHIWRRETREPELYNIAADYIVNAYIDSLISDVKSNSRGKQFMSRPDGLLSDNSYVNMSVEEVYRDLMSKVDKISVFSSESGDGSSDGQGNDSQSGNGDDDQQGNQSGQGGNGQQGKKKKKNTNGGGAGKKQRKVFGTGEQRINAPTNHDLWKEEEKKGKAHKQQMETTWHSRMLASAQHLKNCGNVPAGLQRFIGKLQRPQIDWRQALADYIVEVNTDYGWTPPDTRIDPDVFGTYMPAFSETDCALEDILCFADSSGSMSEQDIITIISEVQGIIEQYKLNVKGKLYWFDAEVVNQPFDLEEIGENLEKLECLGGGGTSFTACAEFAVNYQTSSETPPKVVLMLTDGYADVPDESEWNGIPVIWLLTTPPDKMKMPYGRQIYVDPETLHKD